MAGIYIPDMEMPTKCPCRLVGSGYDMWCFAVDGIPARVKEYNTCCKHGTKPSWCPLVAVSDHGRLIDADAVQETVLKLIENGWDITRNDYKQMDNILFECPTIIEAEEEDA